jgi:hypothetical protein
MASSQAAADTGFLQLFPITESRKERRDFIKRAQELITSNAKEGEQLIFVIRMRTDFSVS